MCDGWGLVKQCGVGGVNCADRVGLSFACETFSIEHSFLFFLYVFFCFFPLFFLSCVCVFRVFCVCMGVCVCACLCVIVRTLCVCFT